MRVKQIKGAQRNFAVVDVRKGRHPGNTKIAETLLLALTGSSDAVQEDNSKDGDHGFFLAGNALDVSHVVSVSKGIYVGSLSKHTAEESREIARKYLHLTQKGE